MRARREAIVHRYRAELADVSELDLPEVPIDRLHAWHLFPIRLRLSQVSVDRNQFIDGLRERGVGCSVHWRPLHLHPYYRETFGWQPNQFPCASHEWERLISLPLFPSMRPEEVGHVIAVTIDLCRQYRVSRVKS